MSFKVNDDLFPYSSIVYISSRWGDYTTSGSGFIAGKNSVLTAAHVIFDGSRGGVADEILIYPSYDPDDQESQHYSPISLKYFDNFDPNDDGSLISGDNLEQSMSGTEIDIAHLRVKENLENKYGSFGIDTNFIGGEVGVAGHPGKYNYETVYDSGYVLASDIDNFFSFQNLEVNPGNSGGPVFYDNVNGPQAIGMVSTESAIVSFSQHDNWLKNLIGLESFSYEKPFIFISTESSFVNEGQQIVFKIEYDKSYEQDSFEYSFSGIDNDDIYLGSLNGVFEKNITGNSLISIGLKSDLKTEGVEELILKINDINYGVSVHDNSKDINDFSTVYFTGTGLNESFFGSDSHNYYQGLEYGFADFYFNNRVEEWIGTNLIYNNERPYPKSGTINYVSASFNNNTSMVAASGSLDIGDLSSDYSLNDVLNQFVLSGPNMILGSENNDFLAAFGDNDFIDGMSGTDVFSLSSEKSAYHFYNLDLSSNSGKINKGEEITISFKNIEEFKFLDSSKTFEQIFESKMNSFNSLSDIIPTIKDTNLSSNQYLVAEEDQLVFVYAENVENFEIKFVDISSKTCSLTSEKFGSDVLKGFERIEFLDKTLALDLGAGDTVGVIFRLYNTIFSRDPDHKGLNFYVDQIETRNLSFHDMAQNFMDSPEFSLTHGTNIHHNEFVDTMYKNVLLRTPSSDELYWYQTRLEQEIFSTVDVLLGFSESPENITLLSSRIDEGIWLN